MYIYVEVIIRFMIVLLETGIFIIFIVIILIIAICLLRYWIQRDYSLVTQTSYALNER